MTSPSNTSGTVRGDAGRSGSISAEPGLNKISRSFFIGLAAIALMLLTAGIGAFWYLTANGPLALLNRGDRAIAAATAFVPARAPFAFSLLTNPDKLIARQQAVPNTDPQQVLEIARKIEQSVFRESLLDYELDIRPWVREEITVAIAQSDLDDASGAQPGYLLALEIAPGQSKLAKESLQRFWQMQSLGGDRFGSEQLNGARLLYSLSDSRLSGSSERPLGRASALVGNQYVLFANDERVIRRSLRAAETATNLVQSRAYRGAADELPQNRLGLISFDVAALAAMDGTAQESDWVTASLELAPGGLAVTALLPEERPLLDGRAVRQVDAPKRELPELFGWVPADSAIALTSRDFAQLEATLTAAGLAVELPDVLAARDEAEGDEPERVASIPWDWVAGDYAIAQGASGGDWVWVVERTAEGIARVDEAARSLGYNAVSLAFGDREAIAWTRFKARSSRRQSSTLETEVLGLHLQQRNEQGDYEIFASSIAAMDAALSAAENSLLNSPRFVRSASELGGELIGEQSGYLYADWPAIAATLSRNSILSRGVSALQPLGQEVETLVATRTDRQARLFLQFEQPVVRESL